MSAIFLGSFKPPHKGHWHVVETLLKRPDVNQVYVIISPTVRNSFDYFQSLAVWKIYRKRLLNETDRKKLHIIVAEKNPVLEAMTLTRRLLKDGTGKVLLIKSSKDESNTRFAIIKRLSKERIQVIILPTFRHLHSTDMRRALAQGDYESFVSFLPDKLFSEDREKIWRVLRK